MMKRRNDCSANLATMMAGVVVLGALLHAPARAQDTLAVPQTATTATEGLQLPENARAKPQLIVIQNFRPHDARGINVFEAPKDPGVGYDGFQLAWGAAFTQQFQSLSHSNTAAPNIVGGVDINRLIPIGSGFNNAVANLYLDAQLARGIRVEMTSYLSSRHHNEVWVKDGYLLIDASPWENATLDNIMKYTTLRVGHFEINYGDAHFRRTDNGNAMFNPLVGNLIMDAFTTEIGAEAYFRANGMLAMLGVTGGEIRGQVQKPSQRAPSVLGKLGIDKQLNQDLRIRLTGSLYTTPKSVNNTLYSGSRAGSRYYSVMENVTSTESAQAWSGDVQPGLSSKVTAWVINPFVKYRGLELVANIESATGRSAAETADRTWHQYAGEAVYRFLSNQLYVAGRYDVVDGRFAGQVSDVTVDRTQIGGGWFLTNNIEMKGEYVQQNYTDFPTTDQRNGGKFSGVMLEGVVAF